MSVLENPKNPVDATKKCGVCRKQNFTKYDNLDYYYCQSCDRGAK